MFAAVETNADLAVVRDDVAAPGRSSTDRIAVRVALDPDPHSDVAQTAGSRDVGTDVVAANEVTRREQRPRYAARFLRCRK